MGTEAYGACFQEARDHITNCKALRKGKRSVTLLEEDGSMLSELFYEEIRGSQ
jgi:hypothetical protein